MEGEGGGREIGKLLRQTDVEKPFTVRVARVSRSGREPASTIIQYYVIIKIIIQV